MPRYDIVVVGAGSAGAVLASRLSEDPNRSVLLLEAGPDQHGSQTPASIAGASFVAAMIEPGRSWASLSARRAPGQQPRPYVRGRGVGGSSSINAMVALPGEPEDYDEWERDHGCPGWSWADVQPWFARTLLVLNRAPAAEWGPVNRALGIAEASAAGGVDLTRDGGGRRVSVDDAYLAPARGRANLTIRADAVVDRVLLAGRHARGVRLATGEEIEAAVVVVSAGAIHSPALLLRSGIDTPGIGENLHDHASFPIALELGERAESSRLCIATVARRSSSGGHLDLQLLPMEYVSADLPSLGILMAAVMRVASRGTVRLASDDPMVDPVVEFGMLTDERDVGPMSEAIDAAEQALAHPAMAAVAAPMPYDRSPNGVEAGLGDYVHAAGTCAMGRVVDAGCGVVGYEDLLVCDASVMPNLPRANTHLPTVMIAERIADRLRT